jgi:hypothetical protein
MPGAGPSPMELSQLLLVRSLLEDAAERGRSDLAVSRMSAILLSDIAVETVIKIGLAMLPNFGGTHESSRLDQLFDNLAEKHSPIRPLRSRVIQLHKTRNDVQHAGEIPSVETVGNCLASAREIAETLVQTLFEASLDDLSVVDFVSDPRIRDALQGAINAANAGDFAVAVEQVIAVYDHVKLVWQSYCLDQIGYPVNVLPRVISRAAFRVLGRRSFAATAGTALPQSAEMLERILDRDLFTVEETALFRSWSKDYKNGVVPTTLPPERVHRAADILASRIWRCSRRIANWLSSLPRTSSRHRASPRPWTRSGWVSQ